MLGSSLRRAAAFAALLTLVLLGWEQLAARDFREQELARFDGDLERTARAIAASLEGPPPDAEATARFAALAAEAGRGGNARITLIARDGRVLADSDVYDRQLGGLENHGDRPEVIEAQAQGLGRATRRSGTVGRELRYVAVAAPNQLVVRVARDTADLGDRVAAARGHALGVIAVAALASLVGVQLVLWIFHLLPLREMRRVAGDIAGGRTELRLSPHSPDREVAQLSRVINQIAAQLRARLADVTHEKEQLGAVLEGMVEGVLVVDAHGSILLANSRLRELFDVRGEIEGRPLLEGVRNAEVDEILDRAARTRETVARSMRLGGPSPRALQAVAAPFPRQGERVGTVAVFHDVSELMRLEGVRRDFVANASHELRTPLAAIRGFAETLLDPTALGAEDPKRYLEVIHRHAQRLSNIVEDLLELSTVESRTVKLDTAPVSVREVAGNLIADSSLRTAERQLTVGLLCDGDPLALADPRALDQVLGNLLDNAIKYTEPGGRIDISIEARSERVRVRVSDSGIGIPERDQARIFERFYRVDKARSRALGGTGLGLSIVKHLVQTMRGEIYVESELGRGSTFTFTLPRAPEDGAPADAPR